jgi:hypothetical protein
MELNTIKPAEGSKKPRAASVVASARAWARPPAAATRAEVARRWLPQGRLRRRPDAAAASPAQARLQVAPLKYNAEVTLSDLQRWAPTKSTC